MNTFDILLLNLSSLNPAISTMVKLYYSSQKILGIIVVDIELLLIDAN
jgi:hypothetical protein